MSERLFVAPLGGVGRFGANLMVFETEADLWVVDCGALFPNEEQPGVDLLIPDVTYIRERKDKLRGYLITHAHEDHIGALPYILPELPAPVYATGFTTALIEQKWSAFARVPLDLRLMQDGVGFDVGGITVTPFPVTHSIPDAVVLHMRTPAGNVVHTGDFRFDPTPIDNRYSDLAGLEAAGSEGVALLLSDSTNAQKPGRTWSEADIGKSLKALVARLSNRIFMTTFASQIHRIQVILDAARAASRSVILCGRSMQQNVAMAIEKKYLHCKPGVIVAEDNFSKLARERVLVLVSGSQGEPSSALTRVSNKDFGGIHPEMGDTVVFSSRRIPGNERAIGRVVNAFLRQGVEVIDDTTERVHSSGHAFRDEQQQMLELIRPKYFIPLHGEYRQLHAHASLAQTVGVPRSNVYLIENGHPVELLAVQGSVRARHAKPVVSGLKMLSGDTFDDVDDELVKERVRISHRGVVSCTVEFHGHRRQGMPQLQSVGVFQPKVLDTLLDEAAHDIAKAVDDMGARWSEADMHELVRSRTVRFFKRALGRKPVVLVSLARGRD